MCVCLWPGGGSPTQGERRKLCRWRSELGCSHPTPCLSCFSNLRRHFDGLEDDALCFLKAFLHFIFKSSLGCSLMRITSHTHPLVLNSKIPRDPPGSPGPYVNLGPYATSLSSFVSRLLLNLDRSWRIRCFSLLSLCSDVKYIRADEFSGLRSTVFTTS